MGSESKSIFGTVLVAVGSISAAIGSTPSNFINNKFRNELNLWGKVLQAEGNAIQADVKGNVIRTIGKEFTAIGNVTVISGLVFDIKKESSHKLFVTGNLIQALGVGINIGNEIDLSPFPGQSEIIIGDILQFIGSSLQAKGWSNEIKNSKENANVDEHNKISYKYEDYLEKNNGQSETLVVTGSWIQAIGSVIEVIGTTKDVLSAQDS